MKPLKLNSKGFSLVELSIVVLVVIALATVGILVFHRHQQQNGDKPIGQLNVKTSSAYITSRASGSCNPKAQTTFTYLSVSSAPTQYFPDKQVSYQVPKGWLTVDTDTSLIPESQGGTLDTSEPAVTITSSEKSGVCISNDICGLPCEGGETWSVQEYPDVELHVDRLSSDGAGNITQWIDNRQSADETFSIVKFGNYQAECPSNWDGSLIPPNLPAYIPLGLFVPRGCYLWWNGNVYAFYEDTQFDINNPGNILLYNLIGSVQFH